MIEDEHHFFARLYAAFNGREVSTVLAALSEDVEWANGWEGGHVRGRAAVADYWSRQWLEIDPTVEPLKVLRDGPTRVVVEVQQTVRTLDGRLIGSGRVRHVYSFDGELVSRMDIEPA